MPGEQSAAQEWATTSDKTMQHFQKLMASGKVSNCALPDNVIGFVEGERVDVLIRALQSGKLQPISKMTAGCVRDRGKPGSGYVYFRVMLAGENAQTMGFNSVGSGLITYRARMVFHTRIWTGSMGGYVRDHDGMGEINITPFSQEAQQAAFQAITGLDKTVRGSSEVGIYNSVSMTDLQSAWCIFPFTKARIERYLDQKSQPSISRAAKVSSGNGRLHEAAEKYQVIQRYLPNAVTRGAISSGSTDQWIEFSR